ncbi:hypothetical protein DY000_02011417 [Brassica cretica]|uniref:HMG box domain-containing protein n=1 Tax=Brassica cretica TaxID=69181 RepID=A0ABQ7CUG6_BRACR|nr:hypothetical protein DY000_02011417 [Brassica cretica]
MRRIRRAPLPLTSPSVLLLLSSFSCNLPPCILASCCWFLLVAKQGGEKWTEEEKKVYLDKAAELKDRKNEDVNKESEGEEEEEEKGFYLSLSTSASVTSGACALPPPSEGFSSHSPCFASSSTPVYPSDMSTPSGEIAPPAKAFGAGSGVRSRFLEMSRGW